MTFSLNIAGNIISFRRGEGAPEFIPSENLKEFISSSGDADLTITVFHNAPPELTSEKVLFTAPLIVEQEDGTFVKKTDKFWTVTGSGNRKVIRIFDIETGDPECVIVINRGTREWELYSLKKTICENPYVFPVDGLVVYNLLQGAGCRGQGAGGRGQGAGGMGHGAHGAGHRAQGIEHRAQLIGGILIHASAVEYEGRGYLFTGVSGRGKTTMSALWKDVGATVIHDDLVAMTQSTDGSFTAWSTPLNGNTVARNTKLGAIFLIEHSKENFIVPLKGAEALSSVMSNTVQHNYDKEGIQHHMEVITEITEAIRIYRLGFIPDQSVVTAIKNLKADFNP